LASIPEVKEVEVEDGLRDLARALDGFIQAPLIGARNSIAASKRDEDNTDSREYPLRSRVLR
jgi:hypothetical protein